VLLVGVVVLYVFGVVFSQGVVAYCIYLSITGCVRELPWTMVQVPVNMITVL